MLEEAFKFQDQRRKISSRGFVPPSFNDIRLVLNTAQVMSLVRNGPLQLITFDGDVTLYDDGQSLVASNPVIPRILRLLSEGTRIGIVTAAGYTDASRYYERLHGLLEAVCLAMKNGSLSNPDLLVLGGESNYLFTFDASSKSRLRPISRDVWMLDEMKMWTDSDIEILLNVAEKALRGCISTLELAADVIRKERAVGIVPRSGPEAQKFTREQLEETVLVTQQVVEMSPASKSLPFCVFNGAFSTYYSLHNLANQLQVVMMYSLIWVTKNSESVYVSDTSVVSMVAIRCMLAISSYLLVRMISRYVEAFIRSPGAHAYIS